MRRTYGRVGLVPLRFIGVVVLAAIAIPAIAEACKPAGKKIAEGLKDWGEKLTKHGETPSAPAGDPVADGMAPKSATAEAPIKTVKKASPRKASTKAVSEKQAAEKPAAKRVVRAKPERKPKGEPKPPQ